VRWRGSCRDMGRARTKMTPWHIAGWNRDVRGIAGGHRTRGGGR